MLLLALSPELSATFGRITCATGAVCVLLGAINAFGVRWGLYVAASLGAAWMGLWAALLASSLPAKTPGPPEDYVVVVHAIFAAPGLLVLLIAAYGIALIRLARQRERVLRAISH